MPERWLKRLSCVTVVAGVTVGMTVAGGSAAHAGSSGNEPGDRVPNTRVADTPTAKQIRKFDLTDGDLRRIEKSQQWASSTKARQSRRCRSGNNFRFDSQYGEGAYLLDSGAWRQYGGRRFGADAGRAPKFAQKLVAWTQHKDSGWTHLGCPTSDWVGVAYQHAAKTPVGAMLIPGSHDSGASRIKVTPPCTTRLIAGAPPIYETAAKLNPCVVAAMAKAQDQNLGAQLRGGVRYLDMRVGVPKDKVIKKRTAPAKDPMSVPLVLHHEFVSQPLVKGLGQVLNFAANHPKEQIVLDFQHIDLTGNQAIDSYYFAALNGILHQYAPSSSARTTCQAAWSHKLFPVKDRNLATGVPVKQAWNKNRNLIVLMPDSQMPASGCYRDREETILSLWPNTESPKVSKQANDDYLAERQQRSSGPAKQCVDDLHQNWCGLFVDQLQLSIQSGTQVDCVLHSGPQCSLSAYSRLVNDKVAGYMADWTTSGKPTNIEIIDFYEKSSPSVVDRLIRLNWRRSGQLK